MNQPNSYISYYWVFTGIRLGNYGTQPMAFPVNPRRASPPALIPLLFPGEAKLIASEDRVPTPVMATVVSTFLVLAGVWLSAAGLTSFGAAAWAWLREEDVQACAADGAAIGFIYGIPVTACAAVMLACGI
jgi:hypothetical protein